MKKHFLFVSVVAAITIGANAQSFRFLDFGLGEPGTDEPGMMGMSISPNGRYVCGAIQMGMGYFMGDLETNKFFFRISEDDEGADLRDVDNNGLAIGFDGPGVTVNIDGTRTELKNPSSAYKYVLGEALTNDGSILVGSLVGAGYVTYAAYSKDGGEWTKLPEIDPAICGVYANRGTAAKIVSGDGRIIGGYVSSFGPATLWVRNDAGEYEVDPIFTQYAKVTVDENKEWAGFYIQNISNNGKYVLIQGRRNSAPETAVPLVYNTETKEMTIYDEKQTNFDDNNWGITPTAIANNGLFVGVVGQVAANLGGFIMYPGETQAEKLCDAFSEYHDDFVHMDVYGYHMPMSLSENGEYLLGYGYYSPDPYDDSLMPYFATYVLETGYDSGVRSLSVSNPTGQQGEIYSLDGRKLPALTKGINLVRNADGKMIKVLK